MGLTELIERVKRQDQQAFEELYNIYYPMGFSLALQFVKYEEDALDLMQDAFITVYSKLDTLEDANKFKSWYMQIVANKCRDFLKKQKPLSFTDANAYDEEGALQFEIEETDRDFIPEAAVDYSETVRIVDEMIAELPEEQRLCVLLYYANDLSIPEIAQALQVSEATVKSRLKYGKDKMRIKVDAYEKKTGTKLYSLTGLALIPFIRWALQQKPVYAPRDPAGAFANILQGVSCGTNTATAAQSAGFLQHLSMLTTTQKVISGVAAGAIVLSALAGTTLLANKDTDKEQPDAVLTTAFTESQPGKTQLHWDDYIHVAFDGTHGRAIATVEVDFSALDSLLGQERLRDFLATAEPSAKSIFEFSLSPEQNLKNGDLVLCTVAASQDLKEMGKNLDDVRKFFALSFDTTVDFTVEGLAECEEIDIFQMVKDHIIYEGANGNAYAYFNFPKNYQKKVSEHICLEFVDSEIIVNVDGETVGSIDLSLIAPNPIVDVEGDLEFIYDENGPLSNGEILSVELGDYSLSGILEKIKPLGYTIETLRYQVKVSGL